MVHLTLYGKPSSSYEYLKMMIEKELEAAGIDIDVKEIMDTDEFIREEIMSIPAIRIEDELVQRHSSDINTYVRKITYHLLKKENFGKMKKILVPIDFSSASDIALSYAQRLATEFRGMIKLVHVYHPSPVSVNEGVYVEDEIQSMRLKKLESYKEELSKTWVGDDTYQPHIDAEFRIGYAADQILEMSGGENCMIVMGSTGASDSVKNLFGSVSTKVAKSAKCPVVIVPPESHFTRWDQVAYCSGNNELDAGIINRLISMLKKFDPKVHLLHVGNGAEYSEQNLIDMWANFYSVGKMTFSNLKADDKTKAINDYCNENEIDLVCMTTKDRGFLGELFHSSMTIKMATNTNTPLMIMHKQ